MTRQSRSWSRIAAGLIFAALALGAALLGSNQAEAQDQTVASAQEFLRVASNQFKLSSGPLESGEFFYVYKDLRFEPTSPCATRMSGNFSWKDGPVHSSDNAESELNFQRFVDRKRETWSARGIGPADVEVMLAPFLFMRLPAELSWESVVSVKTVSAKTYGGTDDAKRVVEILAGTGGYLVTAPNEALAARIAFAAEFLRQNCDATANTGF